jgi:hypothetical protein
MGQQASIDSLTSKTSELTTELNLLKNRPAVDSYTKTQIDAKLKDAVVDSVVLTSDGKLQVKYRYGAEQIIDIPQQVGTPVVANTSTAPPYSRYIKDTGKDYGGNDLQTLTGKTLQECEQTCDDNSSCVGFVRNDASGVCYLKNAQGTGTANPQFDYYLKNTATGTVASTIPFQNPFLLK